MMIRAHVESDKAHSNLYGGDICVFHPAQISGNKVGGMCTDNTCEGNSVGCPTSGSKYCRLFYDSGIRTLRGREILNK